LQRIFNEVLLPKNGGDREKAMEEFNSIIAPDLIAGEKKDGIQLEGPIGTVFINLHNYVEGTPAAKEILKEVTGNPEARLLTLVGTSFEERSVFFTPIKNTMDWLLQAFSDYYTLNMGSQVLESARDENRTVPLPEFDVDDSYEAYKNVKNVIMAISGITENGRRIDITGKKVEIVERAVPVLDKEGKPVMKENKPVLKSYYDIKINGEFIPVNGKKIRIDKFFVKKLNLLKLAGDKKAGVVFFPGAYLIGNIMIQNNTPQTINLYDYKNIPRSEDGRLILKDVKIVIDKGENDEPKIEITPFVNKAQIVAQMKLKDPRQDLGGIDLSIDNVDLDIDTGGGPGIKFNIDPALLKNGDFDGLVPVILNVSPIKDLPLFLGANARDTTLATSTV